MSFAAAGPVIASVVASGAGSRFAPAAIVIVIRHGEKVADIIEEAKLLTYSTGREHVLDSLEDGRRILLMGGEEGMSFNGLQVRRLLGHTHPYEIRPTGPSGENQSALRAFGQRSSYLLEHGELLKFRVNE